MSEVVRVLYVDDDSNSLELRSTLLERYGDFDVVTETDPRAALERLESGDRIDCLLSDLEMPAMDGIEFLQAVRELDDNVPFIMFTARDTDDAVEAALDHGATDFIPKSTASLSYRLVARRIEQAVELATRDVRETTEENAILATSIESALNDDPGEAPDPPDEAEPGGESCPVPGCRFDDGSNTGLVAHFADRMDGDGMDARLHRALHRQAIGSGTTADRRVAPRSRTPRTPSGGRRRRAPDRRQEPAEEAPGATYPGGMVGVTRHEPRARRPIDRSAEARSRDSVPPREGPATSPRLTSEDIDAIARSLSEYLRRGVDEEPPREGHTADHQEEVASERAAEPASAPHPQTDRREPTEPAGHEPGPRPSFELSFDLDRQVGRKTGDSTGEDDVPEKELPAIEAKPGETILVGCDTQHETRHELCQQAIEAGPGSERDVILIRYRAIDDEHLERIASRANRVVLIAVGHEQTIPEGLADTVDVRTISKVTDLRRLGILVTRTIEERRDDDTEMRVCIDSLNVVLRYADAEKVFRFLHLLFGKIESVGGVSHSHIDPSSETERELNMLETLFDTVITPDGESDDLVR